MSQLSQNISLQLIEDSLPWDRAARLHMRDFLAAYTLHDSIWISLQLNCGWEDSAIAVIRFDPVWNQSVSPATSRCADWPLLFLRFARVSSIHMAGFSNIGGMQREIASASVELLSGDEAVTTILDLYGASIRVQHMPVIDALALSAREEVIQL